MIQINFSSVLTSVFSEYTSTEELKSAANAVSYTHLSQPLPVNNVIRPAGK